MAPAAASASGNQEKHQDGKIRLRAASAEASWELVVAGTRNEIRNGGAEIRGQSRWMTQERCKLTDDSLLPRPHPRATLTHRAQTGGRTDLPGCLTACVPTPPALCPARFEPRQGAGGLCQGPPIRGKAALFPNTHHFPTTALKSAGGHPRATCRFRPPALRCEPGRQPSTKLRLQETKVELESEGNR